MLKMMVFLAFWQIFMVTLSSHPPIQHSFLLTNHTFVPQKVISPIFGNIAHWLLFPYEHLFRAVRVVVDKFQDLVARSRRSFASNKVRATLSLLSFVCCADSQYLLARGAAQWCSLWYCLPEIYITLSFHRFSVLRWFPLWVTCTSIECFFSSSQIEILGVILYSIASALADVTTTHW